MPFFTGARVLDQLRDVDVPSVAQGDILYRDASLWKRLGAVANKFLKSQGPGASPGWSSEAPSVAFGEIYLDEVNKDIRFYRKSANVLGLDDELDFGAGLGGTRLRLVGGTTLPAYTGLFYAEQQANNIGACAIWVYNKAGAQDTGVGIVVVNRPPSGQPGGDAIYGENSDADGGTAGSLFGGNLYTRGGYGLNLLIKKGGVAAYNSSIAVILRADPNLRGTTPASYPTLIRLEDLVWGYADSGGSGSRLIDIIGQNDLIHARPHSGATLGWFLLLADADDATLRLKVGMDGRVYLPDGTQSAPALRFVNDEDCGLYRAGADDWRLVAGGVDLLKLGAYLDFLGKAVQGCWQLYTPAATIMSLFGAYGMALYSLNTAGTAWLQRLAFGYGDGVIDIAVNNANLRPYLDNAYDLGSDTYRWKKIRGVTIQSGDYLFENGWKLLEAERLGLGEGIALVRPDGGVAKVWR